MREGEETLNRASDKCYQHDNNGYVICLKCYADNLRPRPVGMRSSEDSLGKDQVDYKKDDDTRSDEDLSRDGNIDVGQMRTQDKAHYTGGYSCHALDDVSGIPTNRTIDVGLTKPNSRPDIKNFFPRRRLIWRMVMCVAARQTNMTRKTAVIGSSTVLVGEPPRAAVVGG